MVLTRRQHKESMTPAKPKGEELVELPTKTKSKVVHQNEQDRTHGPVFMTVCALVLILCAPIFVVLLVYMHTRLGGELLPMWALLSKDGVAGALPAIWALFPAFDDWVAWKILGVYSLVEAVLMLIIPGKEFLGPVAPSGHVPVYKANGFQHFLAANAIFWAVVYFDLYDVTIVYDHYYEILSYSSATALVVCLGLYIKGVVAPSTPDSGTTGNFIFDYFEGTELYPRLFGGLFDIKVFINCRLAMMAWALLPFVYALKQYKDTGAVADTMAVSVILQVIYCAKFFWWETGYFWSIDIMHDRAGYYICWGCLAWLPSVYTGHTLFMVKHPTNLGYGSLAILLFGLLMVFLNYDADRQRYEFRQKDGDVLVWGQEPKYVVARYTTEAGERKESKLLASGYWGITRHLQYVFELGAALAWCLPAGFEHPLPYMYFVFLVILLCDRAVRDDHRCGMKYGADWTKYKKLVPYNMIPGVF